MTPLDCAPPEPGQLVKLADDLYWMRFRLPFRLNHINLYAFDTDAGWLLLDCGINSAETAAAWTTMLTGPLAGRPVEGIIVSHYHADHVGYAGPLAERTGAPVHTITATPAWAASSAVSTATTSGAARAISTDK